MIQIRNRWTNEICPESDSFIAYKKVEGNTILTLKIPVFAKRISNLIGRKIRVSHAEVIFAEDLEGNPISGSSWKCLNPSYNFTWKVGMNKEENFCDDIRVECASGLHVFLTKKEARDFSIVGWR
jgi:hypothetical protein